MSQVESTRVAVVGQGYVGLPVAMRAVESGFSVLGFDLASWKVEGLNSGKSHIDDITDADVSFALSTGRYRASSDPADLAQFDFAVITVPTPLRQGVPDLSFIEDAGTILAAHIRHGATVILESTTYPGSTDELLAPILERGSGLRVGEDFHLGFSPERIDPGNPRWNFRNTPKVVSGINTSSLERVKWFYDHLVDTTIPVSGTREAEMTKLLENTFRHVNIALINELAIHSQALNVDIWESINAAASKPFGFMPFYPGPGVGGHCLPIDPSYLSWKVNQITGDAFRFVEAANDINSHMPRYVAQRVLLGLNRRGKSLLGSVVLVIGVAYKRNSSDARETPSTGVIEALIRMGAVVRVHDTHIDEYELDSVITRVPLNTQEITKSDVVLIITDHDDVDYGLIAAEASYVLDTRHRLHGPQVEYL